MNDQTDKIAALEKEIETLKKQWPAHSVSPALLQRLDDLEEALAEALVEQAHEVSSDIPSATS